MSITTKSITKVQDGAYYYRGNTTDLSIEDAKQISETVKREVSKPTIKYFIVDNRDLNGPYKQDVQDIWTDLMNFVAGQVEKNVVICKDSVTLMQINRLSRNAGTANTVKAFIDEKEALAFINLTSFPF
ncbi:hypothetical protein [Solibacillus sp. CAU 1738]|uniref:hypothetical protein n=1 Tax=Solibacillus sp. CAU 1738 TaxID=3140363 RepID=UPI0032616B76